MVVTSIWICYIALMPIGDTIIELLILGVLYLWLFGWVFLLSIMGLQKLFFRQSDRLENILQKVFRVTSPIQKYLLIAVGVLLAIRLIANWLGWLNL
jgi:hypothetical protein